MYRGTDYSATDPKTNSFVKTTLWSEWKDVPEFTIIGDGNDNA
jgi:hypothetical protein